MHRIAQVAIERGELFDLGENDPRFLLTMNFLQCCVAEIQRV
ncbi:hypothetical protein ACFQ3P_14460 [Paraburkholderia sabiae]|uniref:Uncharacterized protein n=1 Tax=Paraburkholderia sabiae TaxID=273251 RepID=A0ABU9Q8B9_9BURK|nr:hypothetical protein [Paraburkholderia sabiae]WJZ77707.1 hypothetical protein QEN71_37315 [Paraburkholderia sabiae]CAD6533033.1 hypothetical protein LMG24235_02698 [Paraburkholderia sabiae]